ncbi:MAG TPA: ATPase domain-containing protein [Candidatus Bathyarchaeia archaeon]|nr:ATPase domain-containing protein [Candidatus Bathyarchaeia archaeon]
MIRNQIVVLIIALSCILILIAAGVYFLVANAPPSPINGEGGMMGGGPSTVPASSSFWIISAGLFGAAVVVGIGLIIYFILLKNSRAEETQAIKDQSGSTRSIAQANSLKPASKTLAPEERRDMSIPVAEERNELQKNFETETGITGLGSHGIAGRVATGYMNLDGLLYGGIPSNFAVALTSPACDERNSMINSFLAAGVKNREVTFYVTIDPALARELVEKLPSSFYLFVCNPQASFARKSGNTFVLNGVQNLTDISIALNQAIRKLAPLTKGSRRACIDIISDVLLQHGPVQTRRWLTEVITGLRSAGFTTLATINPQMHSAEDFYAILGLFEGEIDIREETTQRGLERFLRIKRMSNQKYIKKEIRLTDDI